MSSQTSRSRKASVKFPLKLTAHQRESLIVCTQVQSRIKKLLKDPSGDPLTIELTQPQLEHMDGELVEAARYARAPDKARVVAVHHKVSQLLDGLLDSADASGLQRERPADESQLLFQFQIALRNVAPTIWRRIQIADCTLADLHDVIQIAMGWENYHLHQFVIDGERYGIVEDEPMFFSFDDDARNEADFRISMMLPESARRIRWTYEYDFGDSWEHDIVFEGYPVKQSRETYPVCIAGQRACPPEDVGGPWGYVELLEAVSDAEHERHEELLEWVGPIDPEVFDAQFVSAQLRSLMKRRAKGRGRAR